MKLNINLGELPDGNWMLTFGIGPVTSNIILQPQMLEPLETTIHQARTGLVIKKNGLIKPGETGG